MLHSCRKMFNMHQTPQQQDLRHWTSWWFQPISKIWVKMGSSSPIFRVKIKNIWNQPKNQPTQTPTNQPTIGLIVSTLKTPPKWVIENHHLDFLSFNVSSSSPKRHQRPGFLPCAQHSRQDPYGCPNRHGQWLWRTFASTWWDSSGRMVFASIRDRKFGTSSLNDSRFITFFNWKCLIHQWKLKCTNFHNKNKRCTNDILGVAPSQ